VRSFVADDRRLLHAVGDKRPADADSVTLLLLLLPLK